MSMSDAPDVQLERAGKRGLLVGLIGAAGLVGVAMHNPDEFYRSYLFAYVFWISFPLGSLALLMLHHLTGGGWGFVIRRLCEAGARTFWLMAALFLPVVAGMPRLFVWMQWTSAAEAHSPFKFAYLRQPFFLGRAVFYFAVWMLLGYLLSKWSMEEDVTGDPGLHRKMEALSAPGLILFGFTSTFAVLDWSMSLEPFWSSTIYGMVYIVIQVFTALAFLIFLARRFSEHEPLAAVATPSRFHDLGTLLFAFTMLWAYLAFSQFLIIWAGNLRAEIPWYVHRGTGEWASVAVFLLVFHFFVPFFVLLNRPLKRRKAILGRVALAMIFVSAVDVFWLIMPAFHPTAPAIHPGDLLAPVAIGGLWIWAFAKQARGRALVPLKDVRLEAAVEHGA